MAVIGFDIFWRDHGAARGSRDLGDSFNATSKKSEQMKDVVKAGAAAAAVAMGLFAKKSIEVASDISESTSKINVVFGKSSKSVLDFAETSASSLGISKRAALEAAGTFGNLFVSLKLPQAEAAKMSTKMITLAADMASFNNASPEEALDAIRSGLVGETEPLRRFGVNMNDATLRTEALKEGLISSTKDALSPAVKAQAAYGLMLAQTGTAQGDFARTSSGLANQQRILAARFEDLQGKLGEQLLPVVNKVLSGMLGLLDLIGKNQKVVTPLALGFVILAASIWGVNKAALGATKSLAAWNVIMGLVIGRNTTGMVSYLRLQAAMKGVVGSVAVLAVAYAATKINAEKASNVGVDELTKSMLANKDAAKLSAAELKLFGTSGGIFGNGLLNFTDDTDASRNALKEFGDTANDVLGQGLLNKGNRFLDISGKQKVFREETGRLDQALANMAKGGNLEQAQRQMRQYEQAATDAGLPVSSLRRMFPEYAKAVGESTDKTSKLSLATEDLASAATSGAIVGATLASATAAQTRALMENSDEVLRNRKQLLDHANALLKNRGSENGFEAATDDATKALKENGRTLDKHTEKGRTNRAALDQIASSTLEWRDAAKLAGKSEKDQAAITEQGRKALERMAGPKGFGMSKKAAHAYADEILGIPKKVSSNIVLSLQNNIPKTLFGVKIGGYGKGLGVLSKAAGGSVRGPGHGTSDSIPAMLSNGEHVWTAREVHAAGGHTAVEGMRRGVLGLAGGGPAFAAPFARGEAQIAAGTSSRLADKILKIAQGAIGYNPSLAGALAFARQQAGKPYIWGGVGPRGYDCSGAMSALLNVVQGRSPYSRRGTSGSFPWPGFAPGPGAFMMGSFSGNPGHMAGTINGVNVESSGSVGFHMGPWARGARDPMFSRVAHLRGYAKGGPVVGDAPFDLLNPRGDDYLGDAIRKVFLADRGGVMRSGDVAVNRSGHDERVLSPVETRKFDRLVRVNGSGGSGAGGLQLTINAVGSDIELENKLVRVIENAKRHGRLKD